MAHTLSDEGLALIRAAEGFCAAPLALADGVWLVGYGHVRTGEAGAPVNAREADTLLARDVEAVAARVNAAVTMPLAQSQFDALVSFAFSVGAQAFAKSQVVRRVNAGDYVAAACAMDAWRKSSVNGELEIIDALVRRRAAEKALFLRDVTCTPSPSALVRPKLDHAASVLGAPVAYAPAPTLEIAPCAPVERTPAQVITEILRAEPATEALLRTCGVADDEVSVDEISTAHAKPVAREVEAAAPDARGAAFLPWVRGKAWSVRFWRGAEHFGLIALLLFGLGLMVLGGSMLFGGRVDVVSIAGAAAFAAPGLAAALMAGIGLAHAPAAV